MGDYEFDVVINLLQQFLPIFNIISLKLVARGLSQAYIYIIYMYTHTYIYIHTYIHTYIYYFSRDLKNS